MERVVKYQYDGNNKLIHRIYNDKKATYEYDEANNLIKEVSEYGLTESYEYDSDGNMTSLTKDDGTTIEYTYDALGRKLSEGSKTFSYDAYDNLTEASYNDKTISYTYDKYNNITKVDDANNNIIEYKWDIYGNKTELKYKDYTISYTYNQFDKINKILKNNEDYAAYTYDSRGNTKSLARNNIITNYEYDDLNRRISYNNSKGDTVLSTYQYEYDGEDNIISETVNGVVNTYEYNELDELKTSIKSVDGIAVTTEYKYDIYGNKIESSSDGTSKVYRYNDKNQLASIKSAEGLTDIYYDQNGNIRDIYYAGGYKEYYQYDEFGQLVTLKTNKDRTYSYEYDAQGDRINEKKIIENRYAVDYEKDSKEWYDYIQTLPFDEVKELLEEKDSNESFDALRYQLTYKKKKGICASNLVQDPKSNEKCTETTYTLDKTVEDALIISANDDFSIYGEERIETISEDESILYLSGLNQSVMDTVTATPKKETVSHIEYDDFGNSTDIKDGFGYDGEKLDVTGNIYLRARYYNPRIGQFVQIDTYRGTQEDITSQNRYTYCLNNQYKYTDPSGHKSIFSALKDVAKKVSQAISVKVEKPTPKPNKVASTMASAIKAAANAIKEVVAPVKKVTKKIEKSVAQLPEPCPEPKSDDDLDKLQFVLDMIGFIPAVGDICDGINALIYYARGMHLDAMISVGCIVFTLFADTLLKPLKWAGGKAVDIAKKISDKLPNFAKETCGYLKRLPDKIKSIPLVNKCYDTVKNISTKLSNYIDDLFAKAKVKYAVTPDGVKVPVKQEIVKDGVSETVFKVNNMSEFFKTSFGSKIKKSVSKTSGIYQGQAIYKVNSDINKNLKKGYYFYLDMLHKDHIEVYNKAKKCVSVLNLDGSINNKKTKEAIGRVIKW